MFRFLAGYVYHLGILDFKTDLDKTASYDAIIDKKKAPRPNPNLVVFGKKSFIQIGVKWDLENQIWIMGRKIC